MSSPAPAPIRPFVKTEVLMPTDYITIGTTSYFSVSTIAKHLGTATSTVNDHLNSGLMEFIIRPGDLRKTKLVPVDVFKRYLERQ